MKKYKRYLKEDIINLSKIDEKIDAAAERAIEAWEKKTLSLELADLLKIAHKEYFGEEPKGDRTNTFGDHFEYSFERWASFSKRDITPQYAVYDLVLIYLLDAIKAAKAAADEEE